MLLAALLAFTPSAVAAPYVAYIGNVPVHSPSPDARIMVADFAGGDPVNVSEGLSSARSPVWAPSGTRLAFEAVGAGLNDIYTAKADGSNRLNVTDSPDIWESAPCYIDEGHLAYLAGPDRTQVVGHSINAGHTMRLTTVAAFHSPPIANPEGTLIAVTASEKLAGPGHILLIDIATREIRQLTQEPALYSEPCFSPDGETIAFAFDGVEVEGSTRGVALADVETGDLTLLASDGYPLTPVSFSSDGTRIAYTSSVAYHNTWVASVGVDGSDAERLAVTSFHIIAWPSYSPDGETLAYQGVYAAKYYIHAVNLVTGEDRRITTGGSGVRPVCSPR